MVNFPRVGPKPLETEIYLLNKQETTNKQKNTPPKKQQQQQQKKAIRPAEKTHTLTVILFEYLEKSDVQKKVKLHILLHFQTANLLPCATVALTLT